MHSSLRTGYQRSVMLRFKRGFYTNGSEERRQKNAPQRRSKPDSYDKIHELNYAFAIEFRMYATARLSLVIACALERSVDVNEIVF